MTITIKEVRKKLGLSQKHFAPLMGMSQQAVGRIETGYEGRSETAGHVATLVAINILFSHKLIDELTAKHENT